MANYVLTHCYSDQNRGDAGIIEATVDLIKSIDKNAFINGVSVFDEKDERFANDHYFTKKIVDNIFPPLFPEPNIQKNGEGYNTVKKLLFFFGLLIINVLLIIFPFDWMARRLLSKRQCETFALIKKADYIISKGGSFLYSLKGVSGEFFLTRMIFSFMLPIALKKRTCIFGQSIGPFENPISKKITYQVLKKIDYIFLREAECFKYLPKDVADRSIIIPDAAFYLKPKKSDFVFDGKNAAITARPHKFSNIKEEQEIKFKLYIDSLIAIIKTLQKENYSIHLIGQVTGPSQSEDDRNALKKIFENFNDYENIKLWREEDKLLSPKQLVSLYSSMDLTVGTRLHSSIFSIAGGTPSLNIAYHGTKSQGVMKSVGLEDFVINIEEISIEKSEILITELIKFLNEKKKVIESRVEVHRKKLIWAMESIIRNK